MPKVKQKGDAVDITQEGFSDEEALTDVEQQLLQSGVDAPTEEATPPVSTVEEAPETPEVGPSTEGVDHPTQEQQRGTVPTSALVAERREAARQRDLVKAKDEELTELRKQLTAATEANTRVNNRLMALFEKEKQPTTTEKPAEPTPPPNPDEDPIGYMRYQDQRYAQLEQNFNNLQAQFTQGTAVNSQQQALWQLGQQEQQFSLTHPDYMDRTEFVRTRRDKELQLMGYTDDIKIPMQMRNGEWYEVPGRDYRNYILVQEAQLLTEGARRANKNPAQALYDLSETWSYNANWKTPDATQQLQQQPNPTGPVGAGSNGRSNPQGASTSPAQQQLKAIQAREDAARSGSAIPSRTVPGPPNFQDVANMTDDEWDEYVEKHGLDKGNKNPTSGFGYSG